MTPTRHDLCRATWHRIRAGEGFLYVVEAVGTDIIKIGFSTNPKRRIRGLYGQIPLGSKPRLLAMTPGTLWQERALHKQLEGHSALLHSPECYPRSILSHPAIPKGLHPAQPERAAP